MKARRGEIVLASYPFSSGVGAKVRPVLVIQNDRDNLRRTDTIVAQIPSNLRRSGEPTHLLIERSTPEGGLSGLLHDSVVACGNLATIEESLIRRMIGRLPPAIMTRIDECLRAALGLGESATAIDVEVRGEDG